jgi:hypothetical protein
MSKITLNDITNTGQVSVINANTDLIEDALNNKVLYRNNPTGDPNQMFVPLDMNSNRIYNLPAPVLASEAARLQDVQNALAGVASANLIPFTPYGVATSTNVQGAIQNVVDNLAISGSYVKPTYGGLSISNFTIDQSTPNSYVLFTDTVPRGWNTGAGKVVVEYDFVSNGYFAACPTGHMATVVRGDTSVIGTAIRGTGIWMGNLSGISYMPNYYPAMGIETWFNGLNSEGSHVFAEATSPPNHTLKDSTQYRVVITSTCTPIGLRYVRYELYEAYIQYTGANTAWRLVNDSGDLLDHNSWADLTQYGLCFLHVFADNLTSWNVSYTNVKVTWGPPDGVGANITDKLSTYGGVIQGPLTFSGTNTQIKLNTGNSTDASTYTSFQTATANLNTGVLAKPNGTANGSSFIALSSSTPVTNYYAASYGIDSNLARVMTYNIGSGSAPNFGIQVGIGNTVATFKSSTVNLLGGSVDLGTAFPLSSGIVNFGAGYAQALVGTASGQLLNIDTICSPGYLTAQLGSTYSAATIEMWFRPLWAIVSMIVADLKNKKVG